MAMSWQTVEQHLQEVCGVLGVSCTALSAAMDDCGGLTVAGQDDLYFSIKSAQTQLGWILTHLPTDGGKGSE